MEKMSLRVVVKRAGVVVGLALAAVVCRGQQQTCTSTDANGKTVTLPNCPAPSDAAQTPSVAKKFPFPGEPAEDKPAPPAGQTPSPPSASGGDSNQPLTKKFPFPGEPAESDTKPAPPSGGLQDAGSSGSSGDSSSSSSSSSSNFDHDNPAAGPLGEEDDDPAAKAAAARKNRKKLTPVPRQTSAEREQEDLDIAKFYQDQADYKGAYLRATDAVSLADDDAYAHFALAEAARKLGKLDEAETHYKKVLTLDPVPKIKKAAEAALKQMAGG